MDGYVIPQDSARNDKKRQKGNTPNPFVSRHPITMNTKTKAAITILATAAIAILLLKFHTTLPFAALLATIVFIVALYQILPSRFNPNFFVLEIMLGAGFALAILTQNLHVNIPGWAVWAWMGISVAISVFGPIPLRKLSSKSFH